MSDGDSSVRGDETGEPDDAVRMQFDWATTEPSAAVAEAIAVASNSEPDEIEPLYSYIDPESLDALAAPTATSRCETTNSISFSYDEYDVTIRNNGEVRVQKNGSV